MHSLSFFWLMLLASIVAMLGRFIKIPYTIALVLTGLIVGFLGLLPGVHLEPHILFAIFLPPLLFEAGINIHFQPLQRQWKIIGMLAVVGTLLSTIMVGYGMHYLLEMPILVALLFGAMISPTDPISVLALFKRLGVNERLATTVEAESLFNDGIAVVLFGVILGVMNTNTFSLSESVLTFVMTIFGGAAIGIVIGTSASFITKEFDDHLLEVTLTTIVAYGSYLAAEHFHLSGVIAVVTASLVVGNYGLPKGMTSSSRMAVLAFWEYAAFAVNSMVFLLVGVEITGMPMIVSHSSIMIAVIIVLLGRAISVYSLTALLSAFGQPIPLSWRHVLVWSGLRGALSMAMVIGINAEIPGREMLIPLIFGVVLFSLVGQGLTIEPLISKLGLSQKKCNLKEYQLLVGENMSIRIALEELERNVRQGMISSFAYNQMVRRVTLRQGIIEKEIKKLHIADESIAKNEMEKVERIVMLAQKTALENLARSGAMELCIVADLLNKLEGEEEKKSTL